MLKIILGSQSPRRKELFSYFNFSFEQASPSFIEEMIPFKGDPEGYVLELSNGKAASLYPLYPDAAILTADTAVFWNGKVYNKPQDYEEAFQFLSEFSGQWHQVLTGVTLFYKGQIFQKTEETRVLFNALTPEQIHVYLKHTHWQDKSGGYTIQKMGVLLVERIEGCYYNVMGFPLNTVRSLFLHLGIDLWNFVK
jgi:septum formation protein